MAHDGREQWGSWLQFFFSMIGCVVGLGNIWRFPYVCYRNGGGAFLIPFCICLFVCGFPIGFLEFLYSQYSSLGPGRVWIVCPLFKGIWCCMVITIFVISTYYAMLMAWILYYLCISFSANLPWSSCDNYWNSPDCITQQFIANTTDSNITNVTDYVSSQEEYWLNKVLEKSQSISNIGTIRWEVMLCLLAVWIITFLCIFKGVRVMGKVAYVLATVPYILLTVLFIRGLMLPGSLDGIHYLFVPEWHRLLDYTIWRDAATQLFFSAGYGIGVITTLASYNKFNNNCYRDALLFPVLDYATSAFASTVIFAYMGYMSHISGKDMDSVVQQGPGLVFIAYPSALETMPFPQLWSVLFFITLFCTGLDSQFCNLQALYSAAMDFMPSLIKWKTQVLAAICVVSFIVSLPMTTQGGVYVLNLVDWYITSFSIMMVAIFELFIFGWLYGVDRLYDDMEQMMGYRVSKIYGYTWKYSTPLIVMVIYIMGLIGFQPIGAKLSGYDPWCDVLGFFIAFVPMLPIPILAGLTLYNLKGSLRERIRESIRPAAGWGPVTKDDAEELECMNLHTDGLTTDKRFIMA